MLSFEGGRWGVWGGGGQGHSRHSLFSYSSSSSTPLMFKKIKSGDRLMRERVTVSGEIVVSRQTYKPRERRLCIYAYCSLSHSHGLLRGVYFFIFFSLFYHVSQCFSCLTNITRFSFLFFKFLSLPQMVF